VLYKFINKTAFPNVMSIEHELKKASVLRIFLGLIVFTRFFQIFLDMSLLSTDYSYLFYAIPLGVIIVFFTIGFLTPLSTLLLILSINKFDIFAHTTTLGTSILTLLLFVMLFINHGMYLSLDKIFLDKKTSLSKIIFKLYSILGKPTNQSIKTAYFLGFMAYALTSLGALLLHVLDGYWIQGLSLYSALTNSYLFKFYYIARDLEEYNASILMFMSKSGVVFQSIFQILMIPLIFFKWGRIFIIIWGLVFFTISLVGINLSYLPHVEIIYWLLIFFMINPNKNNLFIAYDDQCGFCSKGVRYLDSINYNGYLKFIPLSKSKVYFDKYNNFDMEEARKYMIGYVNGKKYVGFDLYIEIFKINAILWFLLPILYLGKIFNIGSHIYKIIADNRYKIAGQCNINSYNKQNTFNIDMLNERGILLKYIHLLVLIFFGLFIVFKFPYPFDILKNKKMNRILYMAGLQIPNVFNETDLSMGNNWIVLERINKNGDIDLVPITDYDGSRLTYSGFDVLNFSNHNSDLFYFGNTLQYRRGILRVHENDYYRFHTEGKGYALIKKRIAYDYKKIEIVGNQKYIVTMYKNNSSFVSSDKNNIDRHKQKKVLSLIFNYDGNNLIIMDNKFYDTELSRF
jgi:predicted DCC family thiol-disulfide oxidoreductase YuxK